MTASTVTTRTEAAVAAMTMASPPPPIAEAVATAAEPPPSIPIPDPQVECVLCCHPLPLKLAESLYKSCCGKMICMGCILAQQRVLVIGTDVKLPLKGSKEEEQEFMGIGHSERTSVCPFCNAKDVFDDDTESLKRLYTRIDKYNDPKAMKMLGLYYMKGERGLPKNLKRGEELLKRSYDLGNPEAAFKLSFLHSTRLVDNAHEPSPFRDEARMLKYLEEGARRGNAACMIDLGARAAQSGDHEEAVRQYMIAACSGRDEAMQNLMTYYRPPLSAISNDDFATTLRAHKVANDTRKSVPRDYWKRYDDLIDKINAQEENENGSVPS